MMQECSVVVEVMNKVGEHVASSLAVSNGGPFKGQRGWRSVVAWRLTGGTRLLKWTRLDWIPRDKTRHNDGVWRQLSLVWLKGDVASERRGLLGRSIVSTTRHHTTPGSIEQLEGLVCTCNNPR